MNYIELAEQAKGEPAWNGMEWHWEELEAFAKLVAAHEREECAKLCDNQIEELYASRDTVDCAEWLANEIRARGRA